MRLSLRARLLIAVAAVALVGLVLADIATYTALHSFLVDRVDESLTAAHGRLIRSLYGPLDRSPGSDAGALASAAPGAYIELRAPDGSALVSQPPGGEFATARPLLPDRVSGLGSSSGESATFFTVDSAPGGNGEFRVRAERLPDDSVLMVALPLHDVNSKVEAAPDDASNPDLNGVAVPRAHATTTCIASDPGHQLLGMQTGIDDGKMDGFVINAAQSMFNQLEQAVQ